MKIRPLCPYGRERRNHSLKNTYESDCLLTGIRIKIYESWKVLQEIVPYEFLSSTFQSLFWNREQFKKTFITASSGLPNVYSTIHDWRHSPLLSSFYNDKIHKIRWAIASKEKVDNLDDNSDNILGTLFHKNSQFYVFSFD